MPKLANFSNATRSHGRRGCVLRASLMRVFWRAPQRWELTICALYALAVYFLSDFSSAAIASRTLWVFFVMRFWQLADDYPQRKWPDKEVGSYSLYLSLFLAFGIPILAGLFHNPPAWKQVLALVALIAAGYAWVFPLMWLLDRVFKPWMKRTEYRVFPALIFVLCCGVWFFVSMCFLLRSTIATAA